MTACKLYEYPSSGNCYKLRLAMALLGVDFERETVDITRGESRTPAFLAINPNGRVPVLRTPAGEYLPESNAALWYLAHRSALLPDTRLEQAQVLQWMCFEQYSHEPYIATSRYWLLVLNGRETHAEQLAEKQAPGYAALAVMDAHLGTRAFFVAESLSIADIALYAYTHVAHEGGFDLAAYPAIRAWIDRIANTPGYVRITD